MNIPANLLKPRFHRAEKEMTEETLEELKLQHTLAVEEMVKAVDKVNEIKMRIYSIEAEKARKELGLE
jgi:hypothetical protein